MFRSGLCVYHETQTVRNVNVVLNIIMNLCELQMYKVMASQMSENNWLLVKESYI